MEKTPAAPQRQKLEDGEVAVYFLQFVDVLLVCLVIYVIFKILRRKIIRPLVNDEHIKFQKVEGMLTEFVHFPSHFFSPESQAQQQFETIFIMLTGNPGVATLYKPFMSELHATLNHERVGVVTIGFAGHSFHHDDHYQYNLEEQIEHKVAVVKKMRAKYPNAKFMIGGHSIGSYIIIQMLKRLENEVHFEKKFFLFPTIQHMNKTPNYHKMKYLTYAPVRQIAGTMVHFLGQILPRIVSTTLLSIGVKATPIVSQWLPHFMRYSLIANVAYLACWEFDTVKELDEDVLRKHHDSLYFYFGATDEWVPMELANDIVTRFPELHKKQQIVIDRLGCRHAFCIYENDIKVLSAWLKQHILAK